MKTIKMEKLQRERKIKTRSGEELIDGLPVLRGMFVCPESLKDNPGPRPPLMSLFERKVYDQDSPLHEEKNWGSNWVGQD